MNEWKHAVVVGASSGIGCAIARKLAASGVKVAVVARRSAELEQVAKAINDAVGEERAFPFAHDVLDRQSIPGLFQHIARTLGGMDLVVFAAAYQPEVGANDYPSNDDALVVETNLTGCIAWCNEAARRFAQLGGGTIIGISSIAGDRGRRLAPAYGASKSGMSTFLESLRNRLSQHGVHVTTIKPGFVDTASTRGRKGLFWLISAERAAELILKAGASGRSTVYVPGRWWAVSLVIRIIPSTIFRRLSI